MLLEIMNNYKNGIFSACSEYIAVTTFLSQHVVLKSVGNCKTVRFLTQQPDMKYINKVMFSVDYSVVFIRCHHDNGSSYTDVSIIKV